MTKAICDFLDCGRGVSAGSLCATHYNHKRAGKTLLPIKPQRTRGYDSTDPDACWLWQGTIEKLGYGVLYADGRLQKAHRYIWEQRVGPIPAGLVLDHKCFTRSCVNPAHLRAVTQKQNCEHQRGANSNSSSGIRNVSLSGGKWRVEIRHHRKRIPLGLFERIEDAEAAAIAGRAKYFTHAD